MRLGLALVAVLITSSISAQALLRRAGDLHAVPAQGLRAALERTLHGPTPAQRAAGLGTAVPSGVRLLALTRTADSVTLTVNAALVQAGSVSEDAIEQIVKCALRASGAASVHIRVKGPDGVVRRLTDLLTEAPVERRRAPPRTAAANFGALAGKTIAISPGHGYYWHSTLGWITQRPLIGGLIEDIHNAEIAHRFLIPALENMGAKVISCRERGEGVYDAVSDNDFSGSSYGSTGAWGNFSGGFFRSHDVAATASTVTATATWRLQVAADGHYPVYAWMPVVSRAAARARYTVHHSGGTSLVEFDQRKHHLRWALLGVFHFSRQSQAKVVLDNQGASGVVVADAIRLGGGRGTIARGSGTSGKPRWQECSRYWTQFAGAPSSVWNSTTGQDNNDDVTARPRYAEWRGADAFLSLHSNAGGGKGTSSFIYNGTPSPGSAAFQRAVHTQLIQEIRAGWDSTWTDRGRKSANFGEVRVLRTMPGTLIELAFHDTANSKDHQALHHPRFRFLAGRAMARGIMRYFSAAAFPPPAPTALRVVQSGNRGLTVAWDQVAGATHYTVEQSPDGKGFVEVGRSNGAAWSTPALPHGTVRSFRVRAWNASGRSFPTEVLTAGTSHTKRAELLLVNGFDRLGRYVKSPENTGDYLRLHGAAIRAAGELSLGFDAASNEAVQRGRVQLRSYRAVDWACGEESTADESLSSSEQALLTTYLNGGGRLLLTGAEIGWDLWHRGSASDRAFFTNTLGARYVQDDAGTYGFRAASGAHIFSGLLAGAFDDGRFGTYDVDYPDVLGAADSRSTLCLEYDNGRGAAIQRVVGSSRLVFVGFPLETILTERQRGEVMVRALRFLLAGRALEAPRSMPIGTTSHLTIRSPAAARSGYVLAASSRLGAIPLPPDHVVPLFPDPILDLSLQPNAIFVAFRGTLDASGNGTGRFVVPSLPIAKGVDVFFSGLTLASGGAIRDTLPWVRLSIR